MRVAHGALVVLELGLGNYQSALRHGLAAFGDEPVVSSRDSEVRPGRGGGPLRDRQAAAAVLDAFSPRELASGTDYHLHQVFRKLDITTRAHLVRALAEPGGHVQG